MSEVIFYLIVVSLWVYAILTDAMADRLARYADCSISRIVFAVYLKKVYCK